MNEELTTLKAERSTLNVQRKKTNIEQKAIEEQLELLTASIRAK